MKTILKTGETIKYEFYEKEELFNKMRNEFKIKMQKHQEFLKKLKEKKNKNSYFEQGNGNRPYAVR